MIDFLGTIDPDNGLVERGTAIPPSPPSELLWRCIVRLRSSAAEHGHALSPRVVGAYGQSRTHTMKRAVGEAVERYALLPGSSAPPGTVTGATAAELGPRALPFVDPDVALGAREAEGVPLTWYPARRLADDGPYSEVLVPAPLVDYPDPSPAAVHFDPTPSGAASGDSPDMALRSALLELIERDALLTAWETRLRPHRLRIEDPVDIRASSPRERELHALWRKIGAADLTAVLASLPTGLPGIHCTVGTVLDESRTNGPLATLGCNATDDPAWSALGALQEALQVRSAIVNSPTPLPRDFGRDEKIRDDDDRLRYVASEQGYERVAEWVAAFDTERERSPAVDVSTKELIGLVASEGADPLAVDLTYRLPAPLCAMGWHAAKVIPVGLQALRLAEDKAFTWHTRRLATVKERTGLRTAPESAYAWRPHPLP